MIHDEIWFKDQDVRSKLLKMGVNMPHFMKSIEKPPVFTVLRINTLKMAADEIMKEINIHILKDSECTGKQPFHSFLHETIPDTLVIKHRGPVARKPSGVSIVVDSLCGMAVLRGANIYAVGVLAAPKDLPIGCKVAVLVAVAGDCLKGSTKFEGLTRFIGNGVARMCRGDIFVREKSGLAVEMTEALYEAPSLNSLLPSLVFPQNLPSLVCGFALDVCWEHRVLDMCAAPGVADTWPPKPPLPPPLLRVKVTDNVAGGKTGHIALLMQNKGRIVAVDKSSNRLNKLRQHLQDWQLSNVDLVLADARSLSSRGSAGGERGEQKFPAEGFDRILLDAPCSGLGQRPLISCNLSLIALDAFPSLQKQLFHQAYDLLAPEGVLVYSTCTVTIEENEGVVAWALDTFPALMLVKPKLKLKANVHPIAVQGIPIGDLSNLFRFNYINSDTADTDTIGFFIAKFVKKN